MRTLSRLIAAASLAALPGAHAAAQNPPRADSTPTAPPAAPPAARRDPTNTLPLVTSRTARFTTDEGTWISVDVSPDGGTLVFDLLGDIYTLPVAGGKATRVIGGTSVDAQPRFSPDGKTLVFTSDRNGADATWLAGVDGRNLRLLAPGGMHPVFTPDGRQVITGNRLVDVRGGAGIPLAGVGTAASFTADGRYIWFQTGTQAAKYDRTTGTVSSRTNLPGGALRPMVTKDGKRLAYFTRYEAKSALVVRDLATGGEQWVTLGTQPESYVPPPAFQGQLPPGAPPPPTPAPTGIGPLPSSAWMPDERAIVTAFGGKLWRVDVPSGRRTAIPFTADVEQSLGALVRGTHAIGDSVMAREIREPALSPDGRRVAFTALGKVWLMDLPNGAPRRLTNTAGVVEMSPTFTPDGRAVTYATWTDAAGGDIHQVNVAGGVPRNLTRAPAMYTRINYTPDGGRLLFARAPRHAWTTAVNESGVQPRTANGAGTELNFELRWMSPGGGAQTPITMVADVGVLPLGGYPHFTTDTSRVFFHDGTGLVSVAWDGSDRKVVLSRATPQTVLAPDGVRVLAKAGARRHIYMFERPQVTDSVTVDPTIAQPVVPIRRLTRAGGDFPSFSRDGSKAVWSYGATLYVYDIAQADRITADSLAAALNRPQAPGATPQAAPPVTPPVAPPVQPPVQPPAPPGAPAAADTTRRPPAAATDSGTRWAPAYEATRHDVRIAVAADKPAGSVVLRGARVVTMKGSEIIEDGDVVITGNRITAVGARGAVVVPKGATVIDVKGKTILPGYVDVHAQLSAPGQVHRTLIPQYLANLAFGVTSTRDPEAQTTDIFTYGERVDLGELLGPRVFATGPTMLDAESILRTNGDARTFIGPYASSYRTGTIRGDLSATRADRQRFLTVSREFGLTAVENGSPDFRKSLSAILDGYADHQGAYEIFPLQNDVAKLIAESGLTYTPLLLGRVGARNGMEHIVATESPHSDPKVRRFAYHRDLDRMTRGRITWIAADEYPFDLVAQGAARVVANGGKVALGSNGRVQGLALHWEMWLLAKGGMSNHDILRSATASGAESIGAGAQLGTLETGKLADLQVLDANPLTDIRNTNSVRYVMKNGRLYDANTLDQVAPTRQRMAPLWWSALDPDEEDR
ncbi:MAG: amidohydrolase family protein [Gemmatimonadota bacterium]